jgi:hypothetical protein
MSEILPTFVTDYREHEFVVEFVQHKNGITTTIKASSLPTVYDDNLWPDYEPAKAHGIKHARRLIDDLIESQ